MLATGTQQDNTTPPTTSTESPLKKARIEEDVVVVVEKKPTTTYTPPARLFTSPLLPSPTAHEEYQYLSLIRHCIDHGEVRPDRTGTGTLAVFSPPPMRYSLSDNILPLLTTKRTFFRGVAEELLWFMRGCTDSKLLAEKNVKIWDGNGSREFLDKRGLSHRREGDLGPVYGFQWRHFGAEYVDADADYTGKGVDQLKMVIKSILTNPTDRRIIMSAWNPADMDKMALPPCHMFCQFFVSLPRNETDKPKLSCQLYQRSCDMGLGVPFNIASYAILTHLIARVTNCEPCEFVHILGDAHVYRDHVDALKVQLEREPRAFPTLRISKDVPDAEWESMEDVDAKVDKMVEWLESVEVTDLVVEGYQPHGKIDMKMSV